MAEAPQRSAARRVASPVRPRLPGGAAFASESESGDSPRRSEQRRTRGRWAPRSGWLSSMTIGGATDVGQSTPRLGAAAIAAARVGRLSLVRTLATWRRTHCRSLLQRGRQCQPIEPIWRGQVTEITKYWNGADDGWARAGYWVKFETPAVHGDSGAPVWSISGRSAGLVSARGGTSEAHGPDETPVEPYMGQLSLKIAADGS